MNIPFSIRDFQLITVYYGIFKEFAPGQFDLMETFELQSTALEVMADDEVENMMIQAWDKKNALGYENCLISVIKETRCWLVNPCRKLPGC